MYFGGINLSLKAQYDANNYVEMNIGIFKMS